MRREASLPRFMGGVYVAPPESLFRERPPRYHQSILSQKISQEYYSKVFANEYLLDTVTLRISNVMEWGRAPRWRVEGDPGVITVMVENALKGGEIVVHNKCAEGNFIFVGDVVDAW